MEQDLPASGVIPISAMKGEDEDEFLRLHAMEKCARTFIESFTWCGSIRDFYFGDGIGDIFAVFLARIMPAYPDLDEYLWIVVGDLPSAYLVTDILKTPKDALQTYIAEMRKWVALARKGKSSKKVIPVNVPATPEWAELLSSMLDALEEKIIPVWFKQAAESNSKTIAIPPLQR
jgi:hypothetical protein